MCEKRCKTCKFWFKKKKKKGECHKNSPIILADNDRVYSFWPKANSNNFCGEYKLYSDKKKPTTKIGFR